MPSAPVAGIEPDGVTRWLTERTGVEGRLSFDAVTHGRSNLTFIVSDEVGGKWVLRRPPTGHVLASAHDMAREYRIMAALEASEVPVPAMLGLCEDDSVTGAPFYVMNFVDGYIINSLEQTEQFLPEQRRLQSESLVDVLAALHRVDPDEVGLGELGRKDAYLARQLRRWKRQVAEGSDRQITLFDELHAELDATMPEQQGAGIAHGDYRLDNCMIGWDQQVAAVLDWELCTLGDVLSDLGGMLMWWGHPNASTPAMRDVPTLAPGYLSPDEVVARYSSESSRDLSDLPYYVAFQFWRLAAISEGVRVRFVAGAMGDKEIGEEMAGFETRVDFLLEESKMALRSI
ncbi:MAG: phosphotransferase family protein [Acidimicrobiales bacterium]